MAAIRLGLRNWRVEAAGLLALAFLVAAATLSTHADQVWLSYRCTGYTCSAYGDCPRASGCSAPNQSCGSFLRGAHLPTCFTGSNSQYCNIPAQATCTSICPCTCQGSPGSYVCAATLDQFGFPVCNPSGQNGYCNNPP